jgi:hypothetical protein
MHNFSVSLDEVKENYDTICGAIRRLVNCQ